MPVVNPFIWSSPAGKSWIRHCFAAKRPTVQPLRAGANGRLNDDDDDDNDDYESAVDRYNIVSLRVQSR